MFDQIQYQDWVRWCPPVAFVVSLAAFLFCLWRVLRMPKEKSDHMAGLPLEDSKTVRVPHEKK